MAHKTEAATKSGESAEGQGVSPSLTHTFNLLTAKATFCSVFGRTFATGTKQKQAPLPNLFPRKSTSAKKEGPGQGSHGGLRLPSTSVSTWYKTSARVCSTTAPQPMSLICGRNKKQEWGAENSYNRKRQRHWGCTVAITHRAVSEILWRILEARSKVNGNLGQFHSSRHENTEESEKV